MGYQNIYNFGNISQLNLDLINSNRDNKELLSNWAEVIDVKLNEYLNFIPDNVTRSVLPILRYKNPGEGFKSVTLSKSIKVTRFTSRELLSSVLLESVIKNIQVYDLEGTEMELFTLDRPWLSSKDFNVDMSTLTEALDYQIGIDLYSRSKSSELNELNKVTKIKTYKYKGIFMDNYGDPVLGKKNNLIGYKLKGGEYVTVNTYYNDENLLCNKISIQEFDKTNLLFKGSAMVTWIDIKTEFGFIREFNKIKYYYDKINNLFNAEINYNQPKFPIFKQDETLNNKIGAIDFETYGINQGLGEHQVFASGYAIKGKTELLYIETGETSENLVKRFFKGILTNKQLNGYTFYVHNLGRFDSIFIIKSLTLNTDINIVPVWKDNSILSLTLNYQNSEIILLDSLQLIPGKLDHLLNSFNCKNRKLNFPYKAVNKRSLFYIGDKPAKKF